MKTPAVSRRNFLKTSAVAAVGFPTIVPSTIFGQNAPSNRIVMGGIGLGGMGSGNMNSFLSHSDVQWVAVCDVDENHQKRAADRVNGKYGNKDCRSYGDFREMLAKEKLDAVSMATPDHWHALTAIASARAGCDIYGEKPFTHDLAEGRALVREVERYGRIWQTGSWQRSQANFHKGAELAINGRLGKLHTVEVGLPTGGARPPAAPKPAPTNLDWDFWVGPAPEAPYRDGIVHFNWRWLLDFGGGQMLDWIGHHGDIAHWGMGMDNSGPVTIEGKGDFPTDGLNDAPTSYRYVATYANGVTMIVANDRQQPKGMGTRWIGDEGWVHVDRGGRISASDPAILQEPISPSEIHLYKTNNHQRNFLDCVKSRQPTITPAETAHRSASIGHLGQIAMLTGRKIHWDPAAETIKDDPGATALLGRAYREPWIL